MKIIAIIDAHHLRRSLEIPEGYVLIREGDLIRKPASYPSPDLLSDASPAVKVFSVI